MARVVGAVVSLLAAAALAVPAGFLALLGLDPGYAPVPVALLAAAGLAAACYGLVELAFRLSFRTRWIGLVPVIVALGAATAVYVTAGGPSRGDASRREQAMLAAINPYPHAHPGPVVTEAQSSSDWGISVVDPPESYVTTRADELPAQTSARRAADFYERELRAQGYRVYRFGLHIPVEGTIHLGGHRGAAYLEIDVTPTGRASLSATE